MNIVALAGGIGAGKFLRGLAQVAEPTDTVTVIVNTGDDFTPYGLHVSPDVDSVIYWLSGAGDRERGWGRGEETFRATTELRERFSAEDAWFGLGDLDLATNVHRTDLLRRGASLAEATAAIAQAFGISWTILPMSDDRMTTMIEIEDGSILHFQEYWVRDHASPTARRILFDGSDRATPAPGVLEAIAAADAILYCPSNPAVSIGPILAVPQIRPALASMRMRACGISPIVEGAPLRGMADKLMPLLGVEVTATGAATCFEGLLKGWIIDERDRALAPDIESLGLAVGVTDTIMPEDDDAPAAALARFALDMVRG